ncbi:MAG: D-alanyl-D-alanine carboxypeptidase [Heliobacteriaceae bacterium]|nr:D-alanyl-D-alanine carboxypeptidase [Heliobacteriaceae bacterium]MDD4586946.1 D-alanyl-D-alanine carboxypeptidase [Heliobacteriaceae bacterium]
MARVWTSFFSALLFGLLLWGFPADAGEPQVTADAVVLLDVASGQVLFERQARQVRAPASTTKIITGLLGFELGDLEAEVIISQNAGTTGESTIHLFPGEKVTLGDLLTGAMVRSGNDACVAVSEYLAGSEEFFTLWMTAKSRLVGARSSQFYNSHGLPHKFHCSSAYDLAVIAAQAVRNPSFAATVRQRDAWLQQREGWPRYVKNTNRLLWTYPFADGVKTGTTRAAGACLVASATKDGRQLIAVVLHSDDRFGDCRRLFEYGFTVP